MLNINKLNPIDLNCSIFTVYDYTGLSMQEILCQFFSKINELIVSQNQVIDLTKWLVGQGLKEEVAKQLNQWLIDGTLANIINETVFRDLNNKINSNIEDIKDNKKEIDKLVTVWNNLKCFNVVDFGAIGDGETNNNKAFVDAINSCVENNIRGLLIPNGKFYITEGINTKGVKIIGMGDPYIPFLEWEYTRPNSKLDEYKKYLNKCRGSIITSDKNINIFTNGLYAENIGIFGNRRALTQNGIGQMDGGFGNWVEIEKVKIHGCGNCGINAEYGLISPIINQCWLYQNGNNGIRIGKNKGTYTGETNDLIIEKCFINRNESHGIYLDVKGRAYTIKNNDLEQNGEMSDALRNNKGTDYNDIVYCCYMKVEGDGGFTSGPIDFSNNYSEETLGLLYLESPDNKICQGVKFESNMWRPYNQELYSNGLLLKGWIEGVKIGNNNMYGRHKVRVINANTYGIETDADITNPVYKNKNISIEKHYDYNGTMVDFRSTGRVEKYSIENMIQSASYDGSTYTNVYLNKPSVPYELQEDGQGNKLIGTTFLTSDGTSIGLVIDFSWTHGLFKIRKDRTSLIKTGNAKFMANGGFTTINGGNTPVKIYIDHDNEIVIL